MVSGKHFNNTVVFNAAIALGTAPLDSDVLRLLGQNTHPFLGGCLNAPLACGAFHLGILKWTS